MEQEQSIRDLINQYENDICYLQQMQIYSMSTYEKNYYSEQIRQKTNNVIMELDKVLHSLEKTYYTDTEPFMEKTFTLEELAEYNGTNGKPPYVAVNGIVYDMSAISPWAGGTHFGLKAGNDLSAQFIGCHRGAQAVKDKLTPVGVLVQ